MLDKVQDKVTQIVEAEEDLVNLEGNFEKQHSSYLATESNRLNNSMLYLTSLQMIGLPFVMFGGLFGMNVTVPFQGFLDDPAELFNPNNYYLEAVSDQIYTKIFSFNWWMESLIPLIPFFSVCLIALNISVLLYYHFKKERWL